MGPAHVWFGYLVRLCWRKLNFFLCERLSVGDGFWVSDGAAVHFCYQPRDPISETMVFTHFSPWKQMEPRLPLSKLTSPKEPLPCSFGSGQACHDDPLWLYWVWHVDLREWDLGHRFNSLPESLSNWIFRKHPHWGHHHLRHEISNSIQWTQEQHLPHLITVKPWLISVLPDSFT